MCILCLLIVGQVSSLTGLKEIAEPDVVMETATKSLPELLGIKTGGKAEKPRAGKVKTHSTRNVTKPVIKPRKIVCSATELLQTQKAGPRVKSTPELQMKGSDNGLLKIGQKVLSTMMKEANAVPKVHLASGEYGFQQAW